MCLASPVVLASFPVAVIKCPDQRQLREERLLWFIIPSSSHLFGKLREEFETTVT